MIDEISTIKERLGKLEAQLAAMDLRQSMRSRRPVELTKVTCADCGRETTVPFKPTTDKPIFCKECWQARKGRR